MKRSGWVALFCLCLLAGFLWLSHRQDRTSPPKNSTTSSTNTPAKKTEQSTPSAQFDKARYSLTNPTSLWVIVNKSHPLSPVTYVPGDLVFPNVTQRLPGRTEMQMRQSAAHALEELFAAAKKHDVNLMISTAYRGYSYQKGLYNGYVKTMGQAAADKSSARPGYSEHQTGLAVDVRASSNKCPVEACFGDMPEGKWLAANAYKYGFLLRYPKDKETVTGYEYEPWHFRYIGTYLSEELHRQGTTTLEEFFGVSGGTTYK